MASEKKTNAFPIPSALLDITDTKANRAQLAHLATLTHLLHVRNLNQHRRSHWWRHFSVFRKQLNQTCEDLQIDLPHKARLEKIKANLASPLLRETVAQRLEWWVEAKLPEKWHTAFSHVISTTQYSNLGLVLVAILGRATYLLGVTPHMAARARDMDNEPATAHSGSRHASKNVQADSSSDVLQNSNVEADMAARREAKRQKETARILRKFEREEVNNDLFDVSMPRKPEADKHKRRRKTTAMLPGQSRIAESSEDDNLDALNEPPMPTVSARGSKKEKKKKKKRDAIDDLFAGL